jgi:glyoxylase-like metal-dependent hydrolase (beta-lactamase superfamily II)
MLKKILVISLIVVSSLALLAGAAAGWFFYQLRDMKTLAHSRLCERICALQGSSSNLYLLKTPNGYIAFDASDNPQKIAAGCAALNIDPAQVHTVFLTHSDADHVNGLPAFPGATVYLSRDELPLLSSSKHRHFLGMGHQNTLPVATYKTVADKESLTVDGIVVRAMATPGHTLGSMCFLVDSALFTGDLCMVKDGAIEPMLSIFTEDRAQDSASIRDIAQYRSIKTLYTAHSGILQLNETVLDSWR